MCRCSVSADDLVAAVADREAWMGDAACTGVDVDLFFPAQGDPTEPAKRVCAACRVRVECLEFALVNNEQFGIFGGVSAKQRRRVRRERGMAAEAVGGPRSGSLSYATVEELRVEFRRMWQAGESNIYASLVARFGVSRQMLGHIVTGRKYPRAGGPIHTPTPGRGRKPALEVVR